MADSKLVDLTADASPTSDDLIYVVNDPSGTPADRKVTLANLATALAPLSGLSAAYAMVTSAEATTSTSFTDLTTAGPAVTLDVPASGEVQVALAAEMSNSAGATSFASFAVTGASSQSPSDDDSIGSNSTLRHTSSRLILLTGLTPGSTTFTMKYRVTGGNGTWVRRSINVQTVP